jgi:hypothetical protein
MHKFPKPANRKFITVFTSVMFRVKWLQSMLSHHISLGFILMLSCHRCIHFLTGLASWALFVSTILATSSNVVGRGTTPSRKVAGSSPHEVDFFF